MRTLAAVVLLAALASGCVDDAPGAPGPDAVLPALDPFVNPITDLEHDHSDLAAHAISNNIDLLGRTSLTEEGPPGDLWEFDVGGDFAYVAVKDHGFAIVNLTHPANPAVVSIAELPPYPGTPLYGKYTADLKVDAAGEWVFLAMEVSAFPGVLIYDVRDKAAPRLAGFWPEPGLLLGCHMVEYAVINEAEYLFCAPLDNAVYVGRLLPEAGGVREVIQVARWVPNSAGYLEHEVMGLTTDPLATASRYVLAGHQDMTYQPDPLDGTPMLFVSFWNLGLRIVDVSLPELPQEVGFWEGEGALNYTGNLHTAMAFERDGRRMVVAIPEVAQPPRLFIIDATDFEDPVLVAEWAALDDFKGQDTTFSLHNFQVVGGKVYVSMYHGGIWVLDISTPERLADPEPVGSYCPHEARVDGAAYACGVWDVVVTGGHIVTGDGNGGLYVLHHRGDPYDRNHSGFA